jgi:DNA-binding CsgD family transcriptional regulator/tetratricopeptide (TPR) repeat protein
MPAGLLERRDDLRVLRAALDRARSGNGGAALVAGEAGIGKTSLVRRFVAELPGDVRVLVGVCDDLLAPRALGPLQEAVAGTGGPLERALGGGPEAVFDAAVAQLRTPRPTVLVLDDVQWADDATLDVLRYLARRLDGLPALLVLTYRPEAVVPGHPLERLLGALSGTSPATLRLAPLSPEAVDELARRAGRDGASVHAVTGGNPFFATELLAVPPGEMPTGVSDTVLARVRALEPETVAALEQLSVVPTLVDGPLSEALLGEQLAALVTAEERGVVVLRAGGLAFRHELARRAVEAALPGLRRRALNARVVQALRGAKAPDVERIVHHAVQAGDGATIVEFAPGAARAAAAAGSHRQALAHLEAAVAHADLLGPAARAALFDDWSWELYLAHRFADAVRAGRTALKLLERVGDAPPDTEAVAAALVRLSRYLFMIGEGEEAERLGARAVATLEASPAGPALAAATTYHGAGLVLTGRSAAALPVLERARVLADAAERPDLASLVLNYRGLARAEVEEAAAGVADLQAALSVALAHGSDESAARAYCNLGELLLSLGRFADADEVVAAGIAHAAEHDLGQFVYLMRIQEHRLQTFHGAWDQAEAGLAATLPKGEPGMFDAFHLSAYGRLRARRGQPDAREILTRAWDAARRQRLPLAIAHSGRGLVEWSWLHGDPGPAQEVADLLLPRMDGAGWAFIRGGLLRHLRRAGLPAEPFDGCPAGYAAGLSGDWRTAATAWERTGDGYERALELVDSGEVGPTTEGLVVLDELGAVPAADLARRRLRALGATRLPRRSSPVRRPNPVGLTERQLDVLELLAEGATNAEIASRLHLSVRTVDHHVGGIFSRLGTRSRRDAAAVHRTWADPA